MAAWFPPPGEIECILFLLVMAQIILLCWLSWALTGLAQFQIFSPTGHDELRYSIHVPEQTANSSSGPIFFQMNCSRPVEWFALGQGMAMDGSNMFIVYASGNNITVSPRSCVEHNQPLYNKDAEISVMNGSGVHGGVTTANIRCDSCLSWNGGRTDPTSSASPWIWAVKYGKSMNTARASATLTQHDAHGIAFVNLKKSTGPTPDDVFSELSRSDIEIGDTGPAFDAAGLHKKKIAHGVLMIVAFVVLFPFAALALHFFPSSNTVSIHAFLQLINLVISIAGLGVGISMAQQIHEMHHHHPIIGIVVVAGLTIFQPVMGFLQHRHFRKTGGKGTFAYLHRWFGRIMLALGVINVGLGLQMGGIGRSREQWPLGAVATTAVIAGIVGLVYIIVVSIAGRTSRRIGD